MQSAALQAPCNAPAIRSFPRRGGADYSEPDSTQAKYYSARGSNKRGSFVIG